MLRRFSTGYLMVCRLGELRVCAAGITKLTPDPRNAIPKTLSRSQPNVITHRKDKKHLYVKG
jgi:hypothetical protein